MHQIKPYRIPLSDWMGKHEFSNPLPDWPCTHPYEIESHITPFDRKHYLQSGALRLLTAQTTTSTQDNRKKKRVQKIQDVSEPKAIHGTNLSKPWNSFEFESKSGGLTIS